MNKTPKVVGETDSLKERKEKKCIAIKYGAIREIISGACGSSAEYIIQTKEME